MSWVMIMMPLLIEFIILLLFRCCSLVTSFAKSKRARPSAKQEVLRTEDNFENFTTEGVLSEIRRR